MEELAILAKRMNCLNYQLLGNIHFVAFTRNAEKYVDRRLIAINRIIDSDGKIYEHGKNMTLQKQPHKRKHMKKRAEDQMFWQGAMRVLSEGDEIYGKTKLYSARKI